MGEAYRVKVARESGEIIGRKKERDENVSYLLRLAIAIREESADAVVTGQLSESDRDMVLVAADALEEAAQRIQTQKAPV